MVRQLTCNTGIIPVLDITLKVHAGAIRFDDMMALLHSVPQLSPFDLSNLPGSAVILHPSRRPNSSHGSCPSPLPCRSVCCLSRGISKNGHIPVNPEQHTLQLRDGLSLGL